MFPVIRHIDDVWPFVKDKGEFVLIDRQNYLVIDYVYAGADTFDSPQALECRGIKFYPNGLIMARPFHKFFNLGERLETRQDRLDWDDPRLRILEKMDGSMVHPGVSEGKIVLMTRKGYTDVAKKVMDECFAEFTAMEEDFRHALENGYTPIFEYVSPTNRIVLPYPQPRLIRIGTRDNVTGTYWPLSDLSHLEVDLGFSAIEEAIASVRALKDREGVVCAWPSGHRVKLKADEYVLLHRNLDIMASERRVMELILSGLTDDLKPMLDDHRLKALVAYEQHVVDMLKGIANSVDLFVDEHGHLPQKEFALAVQAQVEPRLQPFYYKVRNGTDPHSDALNEWLLTRLNSQKRIDEWRDIIGGTYNVLESYSE